MRAARKRELVTPTSAQVEAAMRAYFESGPDGAPGRYDNVSDHIKERNRPRFVAALTAAMNTPSPATIVVPRPRVRFGPMGVHPDIATANYFEKAATDMEELYRPFGSNVRTTIVQLLRDVAVAVRPRRR